MVVAARPSVLPATSMTYHLRCASAASLVSCRVVEGLVIGLAIGSVRVSPQFLLDSCGLVNLKIGQVPPILHPACLRSMLPRHTSVFSWCKPPTLARMVRAGHI